MSVIDVMPGLTGPLPWVTGLPVVARLAVLSASVGVAVLTAALLGRHPRGDS